MQLSAVYKVILELLNHWQIHPLKKENAIRLLYILYCNWKYLSTPVDVTIFCLLGLYLYKMGIYLDQIWKLHLHLGHLSDTYVQSNLQ